MKPLILGVIAVIAVSAIGIGGTHALERLIQLPEARSALLKSLRDPESAKFRNELYNPKAKLVCGEYNSKNAYGAYVGFKRFISTTDGRHFVEGEPGVGWDRRSEHIQFMEILEEKNEALRKSIEGDASGIIALKNRDFRLFDEAWRAKCNQVKNG